MNKKEANAILGYVAENFVSPLVEATDKSLFSDYAGNKFNALAKAVNDMVTLKDNNELLVNSCKDFFYLPSYTMGIYDISKTRILHNHPNVPTHMELSYSPLTEAICFPCGTRLGYLVVYEEYSRGKEEFLHAFVRRIQKRLGE